MGQNLEAVDLGTQKAPAKSIDSVDVYEKDQQRLAQADAPGAPNSPAADTPQQQVELSPTAKKSVDALEAVNKASDKPQALKDNTEIFEGAITEADTNFTKTKNDALDEFQNKKDGDGKTLKEKFEDANAEIDNIMKSAQGAFDAIGKDQNGNPRPALDVEKDKQEAVSLIEDLQDQSIAADAMKKLEEKFPGLAQAIKDGEAATKKHEGVFSAVGALEKRISDAVQDSFTTREAYAAALQAAGSDDAKAGTLQMEMLVLMMGGTPEDLKK